MRFEVLVILNILGICVVCKVLVVPESVVTAHKNIEVDHLEEIIDLHISGEALVTALVLNPPTLDIIDCHQGYARYHVVVIQKQTRDNPYASICSYSLDNMGITGLIISVFN